MTDKAAEKNLTGPFQDTHNPRNYYVILANGEHHNLEPAILAEGTTTISIVEDDTLVNETLLRTELAGRIDDLRKEGLVTIGFTSVQPCP